MIWKPLSFGVLVVFLVSAVAVVAQQISPVTPAPGGSAPGSSKKGLAATHASQPQDAGERVFKQQCSRCHTAPDGFSPRISGTIVRHMRICASLTERQEQELLRFLNP
jgi:cytochrome c5